MILEATIWVACATSNPGDLDLRAAGLAFEPPASFERIKVEPPFLAAFLRRNLATEIASGRVFLVPVEPDRPLVDAVEGACSVVSASFDPGFAEMKPQVSETAGEFVFDTEARLPGERRVIGVRKVGERYVGIVFRTVKLDDDASIVEVVSAFKAMSADPGDYPSSGEPVILSRELAIRGSLPHGFRFIDDSGVTAAGGTSFIPDWHLGVSARLELQGRFESLDLPLEDAAKRYRDSYLEDHATAVLDHFTAETPPSAFSGAFRIGFRDADRAYETVLVETPRQRFSLSIECEAARRDALRGAFDATLASLRIDPTLDRPRFAARLTDHESGFSITPPDRFVAERGAEGLASYVDSKRRTPRARVTVRLAEEGTNRPADFEAARARAVARLDVVTEIVAADGWRPTGEPKLAVVSGVFGASYAFARDLDGVAMRDERTLFCGEGRSFELSIAAPESEFEERRDLFDGVVGSFRLVTRAIPLTLANRARSKDGRLSLEPPDEWRSSPIAADSKPGTMSFVPADGIAHFEIVTGVDTIPPAAELAGPVERYRDWIERALTAEGARAARVVEASSTYPASPVPAVSDRSPWILRVEYERGGVALTELRYAIFTGDGVLYAAARCPAARFPSWKNVFEKSIRSLRPATEP